ncbi:(d)CMP kinase [Planctomicrobium sp. SH668]|uniref:(d)CMP kinase n=1 Tax=Planctomicrobium sp. SH668 TaxID=3448126 RepID=UPI003F5B882E
MIVTIDGPAGTGKSSVARKLASEIGFQFLDTGSMYRMVSLLTLDAEIDPQDEGAVESLTKATRMALSGGVILMNGENVEGRIRTPDVARTASIVAQHPSVRSLLVERQREIANSSNIVCEGRDQGTVAFPNAQCKFFLTAAPEVRATRRQLEMESQGKEVNFDELLADQLARDQRDEQREISPLRPAHDAILVDTSLMTFDEVVAALKGHVEARTKLNS